MARQNLKVFSGNRVDVIMDGTRIGLCQSARLADNYALEDASGIGDIHVIEHVPTKATHTVAVTNMCLFTGSLRGFNGAGYTVDGAAALQGMIFDVMVNGVGPGTPGGTLRAYIGCSYDSGDVEVTAHRILMSSGQLKALDVMGTGF